MYCETETHVRNRTWRLTQWMLLHNQLNYTVKLGRVVDWVAVSEFKLGNPNRTPRMDLRVGLGNFILLMLFLSTVSLPSSFKKSANRQVPMDLPRTRAPAGLQVRWLLLTSVLRVSQPVTPCKTYLSLTRLDDDDLLWPSRPTKTCPARSIFIFIRNEK